MKNDARVPSNALYDRSHRTTVAISMVSNCSSTGV
jgi:hypothetical protein